MRIASPGRRVGAAQEGYVSARIDKHERAYLQDLADRLDTTISGAIRVALGLALDMELREGEVELAEDEEQDESIPFESELQLLLARRRPGARRKAGRRG